MSSVSIQSKSDGDEKINLKKSISLLSACALIVGTSNFIDNTEYFF
jgi:hypothetical protein